MILHLYFARKFTVNFLVILFVFFGIIFLIDMVEQLRRFSSATVGMKEAAQLALLNAPGNLYRILPLLVILATLAMFLNLARTSEMVIARASGRSALGALISPLVMAFLLGVVGVTAWNPIAAATANLNEAISDRYLGRVSNALSVGPEGLWLRQGSAEGQTVIHAENTNQNGTELGGVTFLAFDQDNQVIYRIKAAAARLESGAWVLSDTKRWGFVATSNPEISASYADELRVPSNLTSKEIQESFGAPSDIPFWQLPAFIAGLEEAGFSSVQHRVWYATELALPAFLMAMVLIGAVFTMRPARFGKTGVLLLAAIVMGFGLFFLKNFAQVLGNSGQIPVFLAAWTPPLAGILLALGLILHTEEG